MILVNFIYRASDPKFNSIEELFKVISDEVSKSILVKKTNVLDNKIDIKNLYRNIIYSRKSSEHINHITGHINYVAIGLRGKKILTIHDIGSSLKGNLIKKWIVILLWYWIPALIVDRITVISEFSKNELIKIIPFAKSKIRVIYNPSNKKLFYNPKVFNSVCPRILIVGTKENKNIERVLKALDGFNCIIHIIGKLSTKQVSLLKDLKLNYYNEFFVDYDKIVKAYVDCDILCFPSTYEGFGMPIIEAQIIGRPVITSNFGAMKEISGNGSCFVNPYDVESIKCGIKKIISNKNYRDGLIKCALINVKRFECSLIVKDYIELYNELNK